MVLLMVGWAWGLPPQAQGQPARMEVMGLPLASPEALPKALQDGATALIKDVEQLRSKVAEAGERLTRMQTDLKKLQVGVASSKTLFALRRLPLSVVQEFMTSYSQKEQAIKNDLKDLDRQTGELKKIQDDELKEENALRQQISLIEAQKAGVPPDLHPSYLHYLNQVVARGNLRVQWVDLLEKQRQVLEQQKELLASLQPQLQQLEKAWKAEILKRRAPVVPLTSQIARIAKGWAAIPSRVWGWFTGLLESGRLSAFIWSNLTLLIGLLILLVLLAWGTRRLNRLATIRFVTWRSSARDRHLLPFLILGHVLIHDLLLLSLIFWLGFVFWTFGLLNSAPAHIILSILVTLWALRLTLQWVGWYFREQEPRVLLLGPATARFYRRSLKLFLVYLFVGIFAIEEAGFLGFSDPSRRLMEHLFLRGILLWALWLLRRRHFPLLLKELKDQTWLYRPAIVSFIRGVILALLVICILADLMGLQNLSIYLTRGTAYTLMHLVIGWLFWLAADRIIFHLLHPEDGWVRARYPAREELWQKLYLSFRWVIFLIVAAGVVIWSLSSWGVPPKRVAGAFQWATWGPTFGPVHLTPLHVAGAVLVLYLGVFISRLIRSIMMVRVFPRTGFDIGVQYTVSMTVHYVIVILAAIMALYLVGFPLTSLALVAGALGVGIGFGLQNIVNNFISGLILLFERPIKVGDMLEVDGQWGKVKEIRVRSTIFETFDRSVLIIPNSELVSQKVLNWTRYGEGINRLTLKVGVSYGSDVRQVTQLLTQVCKANPRVVPDPSPQIYFAVYGDSSLDFTISVYLRTPGDRIPATHEINSAIFETFQEHGIEIPFPRWDLHLKDLPEGLVTKLEGQTAKEEKPGE